MKGMLPLNNDFLEEGKEHQIKWSLLDNKYKIIIVVVSLLFVGLFTSLLSGYLIKSFLWNGQNQGIILQSLNGTIDSSDPALLNQLVEMIVVLSVILVLLLVDTGINIWVLIAASSRKEYPSPHNRSTWLAGLWTAFFGIQAPTGIPSAFLYWWFIIRNSKND